jgi:uncharacterized metal-binding protein YceD (DUF177 family)
MSAKPLSFSLRPDEIPAAGLHIRIEASDAERQTLAGELGIPEVTALTADIDVRPLPGGAISMRGAMKASVVQMDVVTLEPVRQAVEEDIDLTLVAAEEAAETPPTPPAAGPGEEDGPELFRDGRIELGALVGEHLALGLDLYPRAPGVEFPGHVEDDASAETSPFAALAKFKKDKD